MFDVIGVGANSVDYVYRLPQYPRPDSPMAKLAIDSHLISCGGQTATTVATCQAMSLRTKYIGVVGNDDNGNRMRQELNRREIDTAHVVTRDATNAFAVILLEKTGERVVLWSRDPKLPLRQEEVDPTVLREARLLHVDDVDEDASIRAASHGRAAGIPVTSDIERVTQRTGDLIAAVTIPIFAEHVLGELTGESEPERALRAMRTRHDGMLCVTLGARGAMLLDGDRLYREPGHKVETVDTTGAGDIFRGAFIYALLSGRNPADILRFANAAAAISCTRVGAMASVPVVDDVDALASGSPGRFSA